MEIDFEPLTERHRIPVIDIFNYYVQNTTAAYREEKVGYEHFNNFIDQDDIIASYALKNKDNHIIGFCTVERYKNLSSFNNLADFMYFLKPEFTGKGIGQQILKKLEYDAMSRGFTKVVVDISDDNRKSVEFHIKSGFTPYGRLEDCWKKNGKSLGIIFMEKRLVRSPEENSL